MFTTNEISTVRFAVCPESTGGKQQPWEGGRDSGHIRPELPRPALLGCVEQALAVICMKGSISANSLVSRTVVFVHCVVDFA